MKLLLADDHTLFRDALCHYIERAEPDAQVRLAKDMHEAMEILSVESDIDIVLLDFRMPGMDGLQGLKTLKEKYPDLSVALLSGLAERKDVEQALQIGAAGYFPKTMSGKAMLKGVRDILSGEKYVAYDHNTNEIMTSYDYGIAAQKSKANPAYGGFGENKQDALLDDKFAQTGLTPREREVLGYLARGESNKDIANALKLQIVTVKLHVRGICRKLGAKNRTQAAMIAHEKGLV